MAKVTQGAIQVTAPRWAAQPLGERDLIPGGAKADAAQFLTRNGFVVQCNGISAIDAVALTVDPLPGALPAGTILYFGTKKFAKVSTAAAKGAESVTVEALAVATADNDTATYAGTTTDKPIASGTLVGRTYTERDAGTNYGPYAASDDEVYLVAFDLTDATQNADIELVAHGVVVFEDLLPDFASWTSAAKTALRSAYQCIVSG